MKPTGQRTTMSISIERKQRLERLAIDVQSKTYEKVLWTDLVNYLIDKYAKDAADDLLAEIKMKK
ncbi:hypothetical protein KAM347_10040 [Aeromonas caviae]|uniref:hypothetical protein n=2 Tax=Aeromonadaceae TaxID=84642 RepID=UPI001D6BCF80|nr:hypothetical protein [Aeromonas veronii]GJA49213.1 hypothetical protein KAM347_10040 [Aeromonas caviae]MCX0430865.1 hypothetical protein [Aeromonas veronii]GJA58102.1 hypothetical protein KAM350_10950 [Aeromonas caviae]GJA66525.1 hypothetical protein KAM352_05010 [Aeromonas caviae]GJB95711.1 hypothetical protein KAM383_12910 [Aeromonas caviae]